MIHPTAIVHPKASIGEGAEIGPFCVVGEHVVIGARTKLLAHVVVNGFTTIGDDSRIHPFCSIGAPSQDRKYHGEVAFTTIGSRTEIREYVSVHRATGKNEITSVGDDTLLLAYVHIAHNCRIGNHVTMSSTAQLAGHVIVEDHVTIGGQTGVHQFVRIGEFAMVGGISKITRDVPPYFLVEGNPATPYGLNKVGLRRAEFTPEIVSELKECYSIMYRSGHNISQAAEAMRGVVRSDRGRHLLAFIDAPTERGIVK
ncbi:MAG: acyl-ACP--UDP-N-acetylglucosamine O-acyltransferase [Vulcanimicrobiaceae bacterium]